VTIERPRDHPNELQVGAMRVACSILRPATWLGGALSLLIRGFTIGKGGRYSHLFMRLGDDVWEANELGVVAGLLAAYADPAYVCDMYYVPVDLGMQNRIAGWLDRRVGTGYSLLNNLAAAMDALALLNFIPSPLVSLVEFLAARDPRYNCSELVASAYACEGYALLPDVPPWRFVPDDIHAAWKLGRCLYRGRLRFEE
jgi:hypothetical protein